MASSQWMVTTEQQCYAAFCPCLHAMDMCKHVGGNEKLGCLASLFCPSCFLCYMGPKIAAKSDIEESTASAVVESVCCFTAPCYASQINLEYHKQKKLEASNLDAGRGQWLMDVEDWYRDFCCCPCLRGKDMAEHLGDEGWIGALLGCLCPPALLCTKGPKIAELSNVPESFGSAVLKTILPCTSSCYASSVYAEYRLQKQLGIGAAPARGDMASSQWMVTTEEQYHAAFCPCLHAEDMCKHVGGDETQGCLASLFCAPCFLCYMGPKIAAKSDIEESTASAVVKTVCCFTAPCYASQINLEYHKQKKLEASNLDAGRGQWLVSMEDLYRDTCCPCLRGKDMAEHVGDSGSMGCLLGGLCPPALLCSTGPKIAELGNIPDSFGCAVLKTILPCTSSCYASSVYAEYRWQKQLGIKASPSQVEMQ